jgi:hypothetical protein
LQKKTLDFSAEIRYDIWVAEKALFAPGCSVGTPAAAGVRGGNRASGSWPPAEQLIVLVCVLYLLE